MSAFRVLFPCVPLRGLSRNRGQRIAERRASHRPLLLRSIGDMTAHASPGTIPDLSPLREALGEAFLSGPERIAPYLDDTSRARPEGQPLGVVAARETQDVQIALRWADAHRVPVSVRGAGTGMTGGALAYEGGLVISLAGMRRILGVDPENRLMDVEPGVITADADAAAAKHGLMYAPDPASSRESTIGGNIAMNAGGLRCVKYGVTADSIAALEVVLADGSIIRTGARTRKNVVGYDLTRLFTGSEGTLGIITRATLRLVPRPAGPSATFRALFPDIEAAGRAVTAIMTSELVPEVMEIMDRASIGIVERYASTGLDAEGAAALLVGQFTGERAEAYAAEAGRRCREAGAHDVQQAQGDALLEARRLSGKALNARGLRASNDVGVPISRLAEMFREIERIEREEGVTIPTFGHAGDGNLHPSVLIDDESPESFARAEHILDLVTVAALRLGGTMSGEHGVGKLKRDSLGKQLDPDTLIAHRRIKAALDPNGILSPGRGI